MLNVDRKLALRAQNRRQEVQTVPDGPQKIQEHGFPQFGGSDEPPGRPIFTEKEVWGEGTRGESLGPLNVDRHVGGPAT